MLTVTVAQGPGKAATSRPSRRAVLAVPYGRGSAGAGRPGIYREKLVCERCITPARAGCSALAAEVPAAASAAGANPQEAVRHQLPHSPRRQMHHPALPAGAAEDAHRQAGFASPGLAPCTRPGRTGSEEPARRYRVAAGRGRALLVALGNQRYVHDRAASSAVKPALSRRAVSSAARLPSTAAGRRSHAVAEDHLGTAAAPPRTAGLRRRRSRPRAAAPAVPNTARAGLFGKTRVVIPLAGRAPAAAARGCGGRCAPPPGRQPGSFQRWEAGAGSVTPRVAQIVSVTARTFQRRRPQLSERRRRSQTCRAPGFRDGPAVR